MMLVGFMSAGITFLCIWRMYAYVQAYKFERDKYTPLFGFVPLRFLIIFYLLGALFIAGISMLTFALN